MSSIALVHSLFRTKIGWFLLFSLLFCAVCLSVFWQLPWTQAFDQTVQSAVFALRCYPLTYILRGLTYSGNWQPVTALCLLLLLLPRTRPYFGIPMAVSAALSVSLYQGLKYLVGRARPDAAVRLIAEHGFSFPSGHSLTSFVLWGTFILLICHYRHTAPTRFLQAQQIGPAARFAPGSMRRPRLRGTSADVLCVCAAFYIFLIGFSRIYLGVHWPTDVLGSWLLGIAVLAPLSRWIQTF